MNFINSTKAHEALGLSRQCTAKRKNGEQCHRRAITGATVCPVHGGQLPHVKEAAKNRLMEIAEPGIYALRMVVLDLTAEWERAVGLDDAPRVAHFMSLAPQLVRAATTVLDRCGFAPAMKLEVSAPNAFNDMSLAELADQAEAIARDARAAANADAQHRLENGSVVEGVVVKESL